MALSQLLDDSPGRFGPERTGGADGVYNERHRLALEELLSGGVDSFTEFLRKERIPNFLSEDEIQGIRSAAVRPPRCASVSAHGEEQAAEQTLSSSVDCSSVTYFPEVSDVEPPSLELGWPAFTAHSYRGVTRAVAHFQPSYGECIYSCKEAARRMIQSAKEVIAIVTDSLTDLDIFKDLREAASLRNVPVYILLDQSCSLAFLKMCRNAAVCLDDLQQVRVRVIIGSTYYTRSGARVTGKVHERFMLIDGNRVATGSYRFNWTDGKLNTSNLLELSGQITERFDEEFRILYAQSLPLNTRGPPGERNSGVSELLRRSVASSPCLARARPPDPVRLTSTPTLKLRSLAIRPTYEPSTPDHRKTSPTPKSSIGAEEWTEEQHMEEEILAGSVSGPGASSSCHASTQTDAQLAQRPDITGPNRVTAPCVASPRKISPTPTTADGTLKECFLKLTKERQRHYSTIRSKLEHMVTTLSQRRELADVTNILHGPGVHSRQREHKDCVHEPVSSPPGESAAKRAWPGARCVDEFVFRNELKGV
ncbi:protein FAM83D [Brachionichthys hirsutus]|uniref:protein FAM83D n=1 Tax=Brachionichthys hirsutus TaxID=412623 RepID=UPI00360523FF